MASGDFLIQMGKIIFKTAKFQGLNRESEKLLENREAVLLQTQKNKNLHRKRTEEQNKIDVDSHLPTALQNLEENLKVVNE